MTVRNLAIRLSVTEGGKVKAELRDIGESGEKSLKKIELAGKPASRSLLAINAAANDVKGSVSGLTNNLGPLGSALTAIGPAGIAVGAALAIVTLGLKAALQNAAEAEQSFNRLSAVLKATGNSSGLSGKQIAGFADEIEASTLGHRRAGAKCGGRAGNFSLGRGRYLHPHLDAGAGYVGGVWAGFKLLCHPARQSP
jgi:tetrahydromethanopterin S-methyltransferase subunit F